MKNILSNFKYNLILAISITLLFILTEQIYRYLNDLLSFNITIKNIVEQFIINLLIISIISKRSILVIYSILVILTLFQFTHFSYYGSWIFPLEYLMFFKEFSEVIDTFKTVSNIMIIPFTICIFLILPIFYLVVKFDSNRLKIKYLSVFLIFVLLFFPLRIFIKENYSKNNKPIYESYPIKNTLYTLSNLFGNIIPKKIIGKSGFEQEIMPSPKIINNNPNINVIVIMGESLNRNYMSLYDYNIDSTPFLKKLRNDENFLYKKAISAGILTEISIPSFFNMIEKPDGLPQIFSTNTCLFKLAKNNGFKTYFYSAQSEEQLSGIKNYLCPKYLDVMKDGTYFTKNYKKSAFDEKLIEALDEIDFKYPSFITLHQRTSHTPFLEYVPNDFRPFNKKNVDNLEHNIDYLNSVRYTDSVLEGIINKVRNKTSRPTYIIFTSDHSTSVGDKNRRGHGILDNNYIYKVPFFIYSINTKNSYKNDFDINFPYISHFQISNLISKIIGYESKYSIFNKKEDYIVCGNDLTGLGGFIKITFNKKNEPIAEIK